MHEPRSSLPISLPERVAQIEAILQHLVTKADLIKAESRIKQFFALIMLGCLAVVMPVLLYIVVQLHSFLS